MGASVMFGETVISAWSVILALPLLMGAFLQRILVRTIFLWRSCAYRHSKFMNLGKRSFFELLTQAAGEDCCISTRACIADEFMPAGFRDARKSLSVKTAKDLRARWTNHRSWSYTDVFLTKSSFCTFPVSCSYA
jgi:hypothetical protein